MNNLTRYYNTHSTRYMISQKQKRGISIFLKFTKNDKLKQFSLECGRSCIQAPVGSNQRLLNWYLLLICKVGSIKKLLTFFCILATNTKYKRNFEDILNRTKDISVSLTWVICLSQWFIMVCLWLYCTWDSDLSHYVSDCTVSVSLRRVIRLSQWFITLCLWLYRISITKKSDTSITVIYHVRDIAW
jgi:hypothetical protein